MATRTIKLRLVLENAHAIRAAQQFGDAIKGATATGTRGANMMGIAFGGFKTILAALIGQQGIRLLLRQFKQMIENVYKLDQAMADAWRHHQTRSEKAGQVLASRAIQESRNIWPGYSAQAIAQWHADLAIETGLPKGLKQAVAAGFSPFTQMPLLDRYTPEQKAAVIQMRGEVGRDIFKTFGAVGADPLAAGVAWQQMYEVGGLRTRPQWRRGIAQWVVGSRLSQYNPSQQTTALERTLPQLTAMGMSYGDIQAATAAFSPFFPKRPKMASRTFEMYAHHIGFRGGRGSAALHQILRARGIDPDATRGKGDWVMEWLGEVTNWIIEGDPGNPDASYEAQDARMQWLVDQKALPVRIERTVLKTSATGGLMRRYRDYRADSRAARYKKDVDIPFQRYKETMTAQQHVAANVVEKGALVQSRGPGTPEEASHIMARQAKFMQGGALQVIATEAFTKWRAQHGFALGTPAQRETWNKVQYIKGQAVAVIEALRRVQRIAQERGSRLAEGKLFPGASGTEAESALFSTAGDHLRAIRNAGSRAEAVHIWLSPDADQRLAAYENAVRNAIVFLRRLQLGLPLDRAGLEGLAEEEWAAQFRGPSGAAAITDWKDPFTWGKIPGALPSGSYGSQPQDVIPGPAGPVSPTPSPEPQGRVGAMGPTIINNFAVAYMASPPERALTQYGRLS